MDIGNKGPQDIFKNIPLLSATDVLTNKVTAVEAAIGTVNATTMTTTTLATNGLYTAFGGIDMATSKITNLGDATAATDAVNKQTMDATITTIMPGVWVLLDTASPTSGNYIFSDITGSYTQYRIECGNIQPAVASDLYLRVLVGGVIKSASNNYSYAGSKITSSATSADFGSVSDNAIRTTFGSVGPYSGLGYSGEININTYADATKTNVVRFDGYCWTGSLYTFSRGAGMFKTSPTDVIDGFQLLWGSGNAFSKGTIRVYGMQ